MHLIFENSGHDFQPDIEAYLSLTLGSVYESAGDDYMALSYYLVSFISLFLLSFPLLFLHQSTLCI